jgi:flotillin
MLSKAIKLPTLKPTNASKIQHNQTMKNKFKANTIQKRNLTGLVDVLPGIVIGTVSLGGATALWFNKNYKISPPNEYIVKTGLFIPSMQISKTTLRLPYQQCCTINLKPDNYFFELDAMSKEKMEFMLPITFTIGPNDNMEDLIKYATYILSLENKRDSDEDSLENIVKGIIEGETRVLCASQPLEDIFNDRVKFKEDVVAKIQDELNQFGLKVYNANIKELKDMQGSEFFQFRRQKTRSEAEGKAKSDISEANKTSDIAVQLNKTEASMKIAEYKAQAIIKENQFEEAKLKSQADLEIVRAETKKKQEIAMIESIKLTKIREEELSQKAEAARMLSETETIRAKNLSTAIVGSETIKVDADAKAYSVRIDAEAKLYSAKMDAEAKAFAAEADAKAKAFAAEAEAKAKAVAAKHAADAELYNQEKMANGVKYAAEAELYNQEKIAEGIKANYLATASGIQATYLAQAKGLEELTNSLGGDSESLIKYIMIDKDVYTKLANANATAVQGMAPKITLWQTGDNKNSDGLTNVIKNVAQMVPPLLTTIHEQTGIKPSKFLIDGIDKEETKKE